MPSSPPELARAIDVRPATLIASAPSRQAVRPVAVLQAALLLLFVANLGRLPAFSTGEREAPILFNDLVIAGLFGVGAVVMVRRRSLRLDGVAIAAIAFAAVGGTSALLAVPRFGLTAFELAVSLAYLARWLFYFGVYLFVINIVRRDDVVGVWRALESAILIVAAFGIIQSAFLPNFAQIVYPDSRPVLDWDPQGHRLVSTLLDPNFAGGLIVIGILVELALISVGERIAAWKLVVLFAALALTLSRGSVLAFLVGGVAIISSRGLSKRLMRTVAAGAVFALAGLPFLIRFAQSYHKFQIDSSALARVVTWVRSLQVLRDHLVIGIGFNTWGYVSERYGAVRLHAATYSAEGGLLFMAVMTGVIGLVFYLSMLLIVFRRSRSIWRDRRLGGAERGLGIGTVAATAAMLVHSLFTNSLMLPFLVEPLWVLWGLTFVVASARGRDDISYPVARPILVAADGRR